MHGCVLQPLRSGRRRAERSAAGSKNALRMVSRPSKGFAARLCRRVGTVNCEEDMASRIEENEPAVLSRDLRDELPPSARPPAVLAARQAEWLAYLDQLPPYRRTLRERVVDGLRRVWEGPPPEPLTAEEMETIMRPREEDDDLPELVPPDDPERLAWEAHLRPHGIRPAASWAPRRDRKVFRKPGWRAWLRARLGL